MPYAVPRWRGCYENINKSISVASAWFFLLKRTWNGATALDLRDSPIHPQKTAVTSGSQNSSIPSPSSYLGYIWNQGSGLVDILIYWLASQRLQIYIGNWKMKGIILQNCLTSTSTSLVPGKEPLGFFDQHVQLQQAFEFLSIGDPLQIESTQLFFTLKSCQKCPGDSIKMTVLGWWLLVTIIKGWKGGLSRKSSWDHYWKLIIFLHFFGPKKNQISLIYSHWTIKKRSKKN